MAFILTLGCLFLIHIYNLCQLVGPSLKFEWNRLVSPGFEWTLKFERSPRIEGITLGSPRIGCFTYFWGWSSTWSHDTSTYVTGFSKLWCDWSVLYVLSHNCSEILDQTSQGSFCVCTQSLRDDVAMWSPIGWTHPQIDPCIGSEISDIDW